MLYDVLFSFLGIPVLPLVAYNLSEWLGVSGLNDLQSFGAAVCAVGSSNGTWPVKICYVVSFEDTSKPEGQFNKTQCHFRLTRRFSIVLRQDRLPDLTSSSVGIVLNDAQGVDDDGERE